MLSASNPHHLRAFILIPMCPHQTGWRTELIDADITNKFAMSASTRSGTRIRYLPKKGRYPIQVLVSFLIARRASPHARRKKKGGKEEKEKKRERKEEERRRNDITIVVLSSCVTPLLFSLKAMCARTGLCAKIISLLHHPHYFFSPLLNLWLSNNKSVAK